MINILHKKSCDWQNIINHELLNFALKISTFTITVANMIDTPLHEMMPPLLMEILLTIMKKFYMYTAKRRDVLYTYTAERRDVLGCTSPTTKRFPEARDILSSSAGMH